MNTPEEDDLLSTNDQIPIPGGVQTHLKAGDGVVYILPILHWGSNYSTKMRRTIHGGFSMFSQFRDRRYFERLSPSARDKFEHWTHRTQAMCDATEAALRATLGHDTEGYKVALDRLHPGRGRKGQLLSTVFLSKTAKRINDLKQPDFNTLPAIDQTWATQNHPMTLQWGASFADRFTGEETARIWDRFKPVDALVRSDQPQFAPSFQGDESHYHFIDMPDETIVDEFIV